MTPIFSYNLWALHHVTSSAEHIKCNLTMWDSTGICCSTVLLSKFLARSIHRLPFCDGNMIRMHELHQMREDLGTKGSRTVSVLLPGARHSCCIYHSHMTNSTVRQGCYLDAFNSCVHIAFNLCVHMLPHAFELPMLMLFLCQSACCWPIANAEFTRPTSHDTMHVRSHIFHLKWFENQT